MPTACWHHPCWHHPLDDRRRTSPLSRCSHTQGGANSCDWLPGLRLKPSGPTSMAPQFGNAYVDQCTPDPCVSEISSQRRKKRMLSAGCGSSKLHERLESTASIYAQAISIE